MGDMEHAADRLDEIQARADQATAGPWEVDNDYDIMGRRPGLSPDPEMDPVIGHLERDEDDEFVIAARTDVPALVAALRAVLDLHKPMRIYEHEDSCEDESEEHREERHVESAESIGEHYCLDLPMGITLCSECSHDLDFDGRDYPCPTAVAIEAALGEGS